MSSLFSNKLPAVIQIGSLDLNQLREYHKGVMDEKELERCPEASFLNNDKEQIYRVIEHTLRDTIKARRKVKK
jgi:hypothetical protein